MQIVRKQQRKIEVDLFAVIQLLWKRKWLIFISGLVMACILLAVTALFIRPRYAASVTLYANNSNSADINTSITSQDINASVQLVDTYAAIILSDPVLDEVIANNGLEITGQELLECIEIASVNNTEVFKITVEYATPQKAANIANSIADIAPIKIADIVEGCSVKIVSNAKIPTEKSFPNLKLALVLGMVIGMMLGVLTVFIAALMDTRIKSEADLHDWDYPLLGIIPAFTDAEKSGAYGYGYRKKGGK